LNRPVELFTVLKSVGLFTNWLKFVTRYCGAYKDRFGWVVTGSSNLKELQQILRENVMIRRLKKDVLSELPDKIRQTISIQTKSKEMKLIKQEKDLYNDYLNAQNEIRILKQQGLETGVVADKMRLVFSELAKLRHDVAVIKIPFIINFISDALENGNKIVLFAHHKDVTRAVHDAFKEISVTIVGETKSEDRQKAVDKFQNNPDIKLFVGSITACAEGITLTASSNVVFAELAWQPAIMTQSEDRCHRLGQKNSVLVQYITLQNSLDEYMAKMLEHKKEIFAEVMN
jgi:SWI/SNF-related matrix-associated actin-dependent regulator 1 of chromatin subfamily A